MILGVPGFRRKLLPDCCQGRVRHRRGRGEPTQSPGCLVGRDSRAGDDLHDTQAGLRQRPGLVQAEHVHGGERLDRVQLLGERAAPSHLQRCDRERDAREQDQALRHECHAGGDRRRHRFVERDVALPQRGPEDDRERDQRADEHEQQPVERALERRARMAEGPSLACQPLGVALRADCSHGVRARPLDRERARANLLAAPPCDRLCLTREDRLIDGEGGSRVEPPVRNHLVARLQLDEVARDDLLDADEPRLPVAHDSPRRGDERCQAIEGTFRADLLADADSRVADQDGEEERVLPRAEGQRHNSGDEQDHVEHGENVGADDAREGAARGGRLDHSALGQPAFGLLFCQAGQRRWCLPRLDQRLRG